MYIQELQNTLTFRPAKQTPQRKYWTVEQESLLKETYKEEIVIRKFPSKQRCLEHIHLFPICGNDYRKIQFKVNNLFTKAKGRSNAPIANRQRIEADDTSSSSDTE